MSNKEDAALKNRILALVFIGFLFILFIFVSLLSFPAKVINIHECDKSFLSKHTKGYYCLEAGDYEILNEFGSYVTGNSNELKPSTTTYYYFNVLATDVNGEQFIMAVRTRNKTDKLRSGNSIYLYGMVSDLDDELQEKQTDSLGHSNIEVISVCLNDNDTSASGNLEQSVLMFILALISAALFIFIYSKDKKLGERT